MQHKKARSYWSTKKQKTANFRQMIFFRYWNYFDLSKKSIFRTLNKWKLEGQLFKRHPLNYIINCILYRHIIISNIVFRFILNYSFGDCKGGEVISVGFILCFIIQIVRLFSKFTSSLILVYFKINYVSFQLTKIFTLTVTKLSVTQYCPSSGATRV